MLEGIKISDSCRWAEQDGFTASVTCRSPHLCRVFLTISSLGLWNGQCLHGDKLICRVGGGRKSAIAFSRKCQPVYFRILHFSQTLLWLHSLVLHTNTSAYLFICFACACVCRVYVHACLYIFFFSLNPKLSSQFGLESLSLPSKLWGYRPLSSFYIGSGHPDSASYPWEASTSSMDSPSQPCYLQNEIFLWTMSSVPFSGRRQSLKVLSP